MPTMWQIYARYICVYVCVCVYTHIVTIWKNNEKLMFKISKRVHIIGLSIIILLCHVYKKETLEDKKQKPIQCFSRWSREWGRKVYNYFFKSITFCTIVNYLTKIWHWTNFSLEDMPITSSKARNSICYPKLIRNNSYLLDQSRIISKGCVII